MIEFSEVQDNVLIIRSRGTITSEQVDAAVADAESMLAQYEQIGVVADLTEMKGMTPEAVAHDIAGEFKFLGDWKRFPKIAVVADSEIVSALAGTVGRMLPKIEVQTFAPKHKDKALDFASSVGTAPIRA